MEIFVSLGQVLSDWKLQQEVCWEHQRRHHLRLASASAVGMPHRVVGREALSSTFIHGISEQQMGSGGNKNKVLLQVKEELTALGSYLGKPDTSPLNGSGLCLDSGLPGLWEPPSLKVCVLRMQGQLRNAGPVQEEKTE